MKSEIEENLAFQLRVARLPSPEREYPFAKALHRRWRADFAFPAQKLLVEVDGGGWVYGRHNRPQGQIQDNEKHNAAVELGWKVLRYTGAQVDDGTALEQITRVLGAGRTPDRQPPTAPTTGDRSI